ncbi:MAG: bifunctional 4-hydroxy-3-methylbut-2-enyl diphosphate reductase/30S ribosomal protein S1 [Bacillota bacterium]
MKILLAQNAGFCFGVKEAMHKAFEVADKQCDRKIFTLGPLIHNTQAIEKLRAKGIEILNDIKEGQHECVIIRSHGVPLEIYDLAKQNQIEIVDATCPFVRKVQKIAKEYYDKGYCVVIVGDPSHPEVVGINGWCEYNADIVQKESDVEKIKECDRICVVAQTTITQSLWERIIERLEERTPVVEKFNTICSATKERQVSCAEIASQVDAMIVIGGYHSSNTQKLIEISKKYCNHTYHIETADELPIEILKSLEKIGITAGASTPDWIIKEVIERMSKMEQSSNEMMDMMEEIENSLRVPRRGNIIKGKVIHVTDNEIMVNIGYKADGIIPKDEISSDNTVNPKELVKEGDEIEVFVLKTDDGEGNVLLSKKRIDAQKGWENLENAQNDGKILSVKVVEVVKGGVIAVYNEIRGFIPASQLSDAYVSDLKDFIGKEFKVKVIDFNPNKRKVVFSRRVVIEEENKVKREQVWQSINKNDVIEGEVKRITDFGAFVDIGGIDGLIHISDLSWGRVNHPSEVVKVGNHVKVIVLDFDKDKNRVSLGLKQTQPEPWDNIDQKYAVGQIVEGKVVRLVDFGAFIELEPGLDGLVHISQISDRHIAKASEEVHVGQKLQVKILEINKDDKKISLSIKEAKEDAIKEEVQSIVEDTPTTIGEIIQSKEEQ